MKSLFLAAVLCGASALAAHAESFTFKAHGGVDAAVQVMGMDGKPIGGAIQSGASEAVMASGRTLHGAYKCEFHSELPGGIFESLGVCTVTDGDGAYYELAGCNPTSKDRTANDCWADMRGTGGAYAGKGGHMSWHAKANADGKSGDAWGQGAWND